MKAHGTGAQMAKACKMAKAELEKSLAHIAPRTEKKRLNYIAKKKKWDIFRRDHAYWLGRWETSDANIFARMCSGEAWLQSRIDLVDNIALKVASQIGVLDSFTVSEEELEALSYTHNEFEI